MRAVALNAAGENSRALVLDTAVGRLTGTWMGDRPIRAGESLDVELEFPQSRRWDELTGRGEVDERGGPRLPALVERAFDDGVLVVRMGETTAQLEIQGAVPPDAVGTAVGIPTSDLEFFPTGV